MWYLGSNRELIWNDVTRKLVRISIISMKLAKF